MFTVYVLTFDAQWLEAGRVVRGLQAYHVTLPSGELDMTTAIACCRIVGAKEGVVIYPEKEIRVKTFVQELQSEPVFDAFGVRVY